MSEESNKPKVIVYSTSWCGFCRTEKQYLDSKGIEYEAKDIEQDADAHAELMSKLGGEGQFRGVPVTDVNGKIILGFDRPKLNEALNIT